MSSAQVVRVGVACIVKKRVNNIDCVLIGKRRGSHGVSKIQLPGGHLEFGEEWAQCCEREVMEETGLNVRDVQFFACTNDIMESDNKHYITVFMQASVADENQEPQNLEPNKNEFWRWVPWHELKTNSEYATHLFLPLYNLVHRQDEPDPTKA